MNTKCKHKERFKASLRSHWHELQLEEVQGQVYCTASGNTFGYRADKFSSYTERAWLVYLPDRKLASGWQVVDFTHEHLLRGGTTVHRKEVASRVQAVALSMQLVPVLIPSCRMAEGRPPALARSISSTQDVPATPRTALRSVTVGLVCSSCSSVARRFSTGMPYYTHDRLVSPGLVVLAAT